MKNAVFPFSPVLFAGILCVMACAGCATRNEVVLMDQRIARLESARATHISELKALGQKEDDTTTQFREKFADFRMKVGQIEKDILAVSGRIEEIGFLLDRMEKQKDAQETLLAGVKTEIQTLQNRLLQMEQYLGIDTAAKPPEPAQGEAAPESPANEDEMYRLARSLLDEGKTEAAKLKFEAFLKAYPDSSLADNAQFGLGDVYYMDKWYEKAILEYQKVVEKYPKGNKVRGALLKQGLAFDKLGETASARLILKELVKKYPDSTEAGIAKKKLDTLQP